MIRYLFFLLIFALVLAVLFPFIKRWVAPIISYGKKVENDSFGKFERYLDKEETKKPVKKKVKK